MTIIKYYTDADLSVCEHCEHCSIRTKHNSTDADYAPKRSAFCYTRGPKFKSEVVSDTIVSFRTTMQPTTRYIIGRIITCETLALKCSDDIVKKAFASVNLEL
jgi:hypothetical protein